MITSGKRASCKCLSVFLLRPSLHTSTRVVSSCDSINCWRINVYVYRVSELWNLRPSILNLRSSSPISTHQLCAMYTITPSTNQYLLSKKLSSHQLLSTVIIRYASCVPTKMILSGSLQAFLTTSQILLILLSSSNHNYRSGSSLTYSSFSQHIRQISTKFSS